MSGTLQTRVCERRGNISLILEHDEYEAGDICTGQAGETASHAPKITDTGWDDGAPNISSKAVAMPDDDALLALSKALDEAEARERDRIACALHDEVGQLLVLARLKLGELARELWGQAARLAAELEGLLGEVSLATRAATFELSRSATQDGLSGAIQGLARRVERATGLAVTLDEFPPGSEMPEPARAVVFRVVRELCLNVQKHGFARALHIAPEIVDGALRILVQDDGVGFTPGSTSWRLERQGGFGLASAAAQLQALGGRLDLHSEPGHGTRAHVILPLAVDAA